MKVTNKLLPALVLMGLMSSTFGQSSPPVPVSQCYLFCFDWDQAGQAGWYDPVNCIMFSEYAAGYVTSPAQADMFYNTYCAGNAISLE